MFNLSIFLNNEIEWANGYGTLEVGSNKPVTLDTLFQAASIGKSLTATATMHLVEKGYLSLDENVNEKLVSWKVPENRFTKQEKEKLPAFAAAIIVDGNIYACAAEGSRKINTNNWVTVFKVNIDSSH
jgi:hypothetical protein